MEAQLIEFLRAPFGMERPPELLGLVCIVVVVVMLWGALREKRTTAYHPAINATEEFKRWLIIAGCIMLLVAALRG